MNYPAPVLPTHDIDVMVDIDDVLFPLAPRP